jgi:TonB family protein
LGATRFEEVFVQVYAILVVLIVHLSPPIALALPAPLNRTASASNQSPGNRKVRGSCQPCVTSYLSGGVLDHKALIKPAAAYPDIARWKRISGTVTVRVLIDTTGTVTSAEISSGPHLFRKAALKAAFQARFHPSKLMGQPVKVTGLLRYDFPEKREIH